MLQGCDVSNYQGDVDWNAVSASGREFAFAKASEGISFLDPTFIANWKGMLAAGLLRGAYHFARPSTNTPEAEAAHFLSVITTAGGLQDGDVLALDMEDADVPIGTDLLDWTLQWLAAVELGADVRPLLYSGMWYLAPHNLTGHPELAAHPLWLAAYRDSPPPVPAPWASFAFWQYSDTESIPGVHGPCDSDRFNGTADELRALGKHSPAAPNTYQTCIDVVHGWGTRLEQTVSSADQLQASRELLDVARMLRALQH